MLILAAFMAGLLLQPPRIFRKKLAESDAFDGHFGLLLKRYRDVKYSFCQINLRPPRKNEADDSAVTNQYVAEFLITLQLTEFKLSGRCTAWLVSIST
jgi:hypothetical protein